VKSVNCGKFLKYLKNVKKNKQITEVHILWDSNQQLSQLLSFSIRNYFLCLACLSLNFDQTNPPKKLNQKQTSNSNRFLISCTQFFKNLQEIYYLIHNKVWLLFNGIIESKKKRKEIIQIF
jgi:hypothetical protein